MSQFEFYLVIAGVVVAIAMAEIVGGWGQLVRANQGVKFDWLHFGWTLCVLLISMLYWVGMWPYSDLEFTYLGQVWFLVLPTLFLVVLAYAITPDLSAASGINLREYYLANRRPIFLSFGLFVLMSNVADFTIIGPASMMNFEGLISIVFVTLTVFLALTKRIWVHTTALVVTLLYFIFLAFEPLENWLSRFDA